MPTLSRILAVAALGCVALSTSACVEVAPGPSASPTAGASGEPVFASEEEALAAAIDAYAAYQTMSDAIYADGGQGRDRIDEYATGAALDLAHEGIDELVEKSLRITGEAEITHTSLQSFQPASREGVVTTYLCLDVGEVDLLNAAGTSQVSETRPDKQAFVATFNISGDGRLLLADRSAWDGGGVCE